MFIERQWLDRPRGRRLDAASLGEFTERTGGLQIDSINVLDRAHYLTAWSRFDAYDRAQLDSIVYRDGVVFEYWSHAACFVPRSHAPYWRRTMVDYRRQHTGWSRWLRKNGPLLRRVEETIRASGPLGNIDFRQPRPSGGSGWWGWKPATHALHYLWMSGRLLVRERVHFQKRFDLAERVFPELVSLEPRPWPEFLRWHVRQSLAAMGAATETDLRMYLSFPRLPVAQRRAALKEMLGTGEVVPVAVEGGDSSWFALAEDLPALAAAGRRRGAARGTTLLSPFDSFLWHRERVKTLFGYDYRIEVYTPGHKRVHGYYSLPLYHDGQLIGRVDAKNHRGEGRLEVRHVHFEP
ncbi:MAG TPA: crosslink repair DNA glycosylase YcaQ family protein, partial [Dongiaceae bacterium]|nr:crosslink repair DNA glycosylase YcaQ family protein [Dongiaceae bacterium]